MDQHLLSVMPEPSAVEHIREHSKAYCALPTPLLLLRNRKIEERCTDLTNRNRAVIRWTDNPPAREMHHAAYQGLTWSTTEFDGLGDRSHGRMFAAKNSSINKRKWSISSR